MPTVHSSAKPDEFARLKQILLEQERGMLEQLSIEVDRLQTRVGDNDRLADTLSAVLAEALKAANERDPRSLSRSLSPAIVSGMRREIKNSRDDMVEALYPITGRLVASSVRSAIKKLSDEINFQLETRFSPKGLYAQARSRITGRPVSDFLMVASLQPVITRAMVLDKASGTILSLWSADEDGTSDQANVQLVSGMLAALSSLAEEAYGNDNTELKTIDLDGRQVILTRSARHIVVLEFIGTISTRDRDAIEQAFLRSGARLERGDADGALLGLVDLARTFEARKTEVVASGGRSKTALVAVLVAAMVAAWPAWTYWQHWSLEKQAFDVRSLLAKQAELSGFPINVWPDHGTRTVKVSGLLPVQVDRNILGERIRTALPDVTLDAKFAQIPTDSDYAQLSGRFDQLTGRVNELSRTLKDVHHELARSTARLASGTDSLRRDVLARTDRLSGEAAGLRASLKRDIERVEGRAEGRRADVDGRISQAGQKLDLLVAGAARLKAELAGLERLLAVHRTESGSSISQNQSMIARLEDRLKSAATEALAANRQNDERTSDLTNRVAALDANAARSLDTLRQRFNARTDSQEKAIGELRLYANAPRRKLQEFVRHNAVFFADGTSYLRPDHTQDLLKSLAALIEQAKARVRIIGHSDATGNRARNDRIALERASRVKNSLVANGTPANRLVVVHRGSLLPITATADRATTNRRVEFELVYVNEP